SSGARNMPITITAFGQAAVKNSPEQLDPGMGYSDRWSYTGQLLIARKFSTRLSLQLMPTIIHRNMVDQTIENNDQFVLGVGGRIKVSRSIALTTEYYHRLNVK